MALNLEPVNEQEDGRGEKVLPRRIGCMFEGESRLIINPVEEVADLADGAVLDVCFQLQISVVR